MELIKNDVVKQIVKDILTEHPETRDDDSRCYERVIEHYGMSKNMRFVTLEKRVRNGELPSRDTVVRLRRMVQKSNVELRGLLWDKRHFFAKEVAESVVG